MISTAPVSTTSDERTFTVSSWLFGMPTIAEMADVDINHVHFAESLVPHLSGGKDDPLRAVFAEGGYDPFEPQASEGNAKSINSLGGKKSPYYPKLLQQLERPESVCRSIMMRHRNYKYIRRSLMGNELYDMDADPRELTNMINDPASAEVIADMDRRMLDWYLTTSDAVRSDPDNRWAKPKWD